MRTFIAIDIPLSENTLQLLNQLKSNLEHENIRWVNFKGLHLTLFFLGDTTVAQADEIKNVLKSELSSLVPFEIRLHNVGTFGASRNPTVLWVGIENSDRLKTLHSVVAKAVVPLGFVADRRTFKPHVTLGRIKGISNFQLLNQNIRELESSIEEQILVDRVVFYQSVLTPNGPIYKSLYTHLL